MLPVAMSFGLPRSRSLIRIHRLLGAFALIITVALPAEAMPLPRVAVVTNAGTFVVQLEAVKAPLTTKNFLRLVAARAYDGAAFYRTVRKATEPRSQIEVIQGGLELANKVSSHAIPLESTTKTGLHNTNGEISMARTHDPNSASSEFFVCVGNNTFLDAQKQPDHFGYAAFGHVVRGMDVVLKINQAHANGESLAPPIAIVRIRPIAR